MPAATGKPTAMHLNHDWAFMAAVDLGCPEIEAQAVFAGYCGCCTTMEHKRLFIPVREVLSLVIETSGVLARANLTILQSTTNSGPGFRTGRWPEAPFTSGASAIGHAFKNVHAVPPEAAYFSSDRLGNGFVRGNDPAVSTTGRCKTLWAKLPACAVLRRLGTRWQNLPIPPPQLQRCRETNVVP